MNFFERIRGTKKRKEAQESGIIYSPLKGTVIPLKEIPDPVFAEGILGFGCGIQPTSEMVYAPFDGAIVQVSDTKHAVGLKSADGTEVLIHVGMDTVEMNGNGFTTFVKTGDNVKKGEKLIEFSISEIEAAGYSSVTAVVVCSVSEAEKIKVLKADEIQTGEALLKIGRAHV